MINTLPISLKSYFALVLFVFSSFSYALQTSTVHQETKDYLIDIKYPQGFASTKTNILIKERIKQIKKDFFEDMAKPEELPAGLHGKNSLYIKYEIPFKNASALSIVFTVSVYYTGAAHPNNYRVTMNFLKDKPVFLSDLFKNNTPYLKQIVQYSRTKLSSLSYVDPKWLKSGTEMKPDNYKAWYFQKNGLAIIFDTYQVAAYVYGPQIVVIPFSELSPLYKTHVLKLVWGQ